MSAVSVLQKSKGINFLDLHIDEQVIPNLEEGQCLVEVHGAAVNPSDVKAILGFMPHAVWPRIPGRDYAGVVIDGPRDLVGKEVWGSGGDLGVRRNGTHAKYLAVPISSIREKPSNLTMQEACAVGVPFVTAFEGLNRAGGVGPGDVVLVLGANGKVGQAAIQLASEAGARVFGVERTKAVYLGHANNEITMIDPLTESIEDVVRDATNGHGADIVYNTVGSPYFEQANRAMAIRGTQIFISTIERPVPFDIFNFYRGQHTYVGVDTLALDSGEGARILNQLLPGFESRALRPFPIFDDVVFGLEQAAQAYKTVFEGAMHRVLLKP